MALRARYRAQHTHPGCLGTVIDCLGSAKHQAGWIYHGLCDTSGIRQATATASMPVPQTAHAEQRRGVLAAYPSRAGPSAARRLP